MVLYQMSRNMNKRFFADFISVLSRTVNPHDPDECNELEHFDEKNRVSDHSEEEQMVRIYSLSRLFVV